MHRIITYQRIPQKLHITLPSSTTQIHPKGWARPRITQSQSPTRKNVSPSLKKTYPIGFEIIEVRIDRLTKLEHLQ